MTDNNSAQVFIVGAQRSGTTMLRLMLNAHSCFAVPFESDFLAPLDRGLATIRFADRAAAEAALDALASERFTKRAEIIADPSPILEGPVGSYADLLDAAFCSYARRRGKPRWAVKTPSYETRLDVIHELFPAAKVVHIVRDGRDVAVSNRRISWGIKRIPRAATDWRWKVMLGHKMGRMLGSSYFELRYEDLVLQTTQTLERLCLFLDVPFDARMLAYHETAANEMPRDSLEWHESSVSAPDESKVFAWKRELSVTDQVLFEEIAGDALKIFGYERCGHEAPVRAAVKRSYYALVKGL